MYIYNKNITKGKKEFLDLKYMFSNKKWKHKNLLAMLDFLSKNSELYTLDYAMNDITFVKDGNTELIDEILDFSNIDLTKCKSFDRTLHNPTNLTTLVIANVPNMDNLAKQPYQDSFRFFYGLRNNNIENLHIKDCNFDGINNDSGSSNSGKGFNPFIFERLQYAKRIIIENSTVNLSNFYNSNYSLEIEELIVRNSTLYTGYGSGACCGDFGNNIKKVEFTNSTVIPYGHSGIFKARSNTFKSITLPNIGSHKDFPLTSLYDGFSNNEHLEEIIFRDIDTSNITSLASLFTWCRNLISIKGLDDKVFNKVTTIDNIFKECSRLETLPNIFSSMSEVTIMNSAFHTMNNIRNITLRMNIPKCDMWAMIYNNQSLEVVDLSKVVIDKNRGSINEINFHENFKHCPNLREIHLGLLSCGVKFKMQAFDNSPNIRKIYIPKETDMGTLGTHGWCSEEYFNNANVKVGVLKNCTKDCVIYTDANYSYDWNTKQYTGTMPAKWIKEFHNHYYYPQNGNAEVRGLTIIGNTPPDKFFTP